MLSSKLLYKPQSHSEYSTSNNDFLEEDSKKEFILELSEAMNFAIASKRKVIDYGNKCFYALGKLSPRQRDEFEKIIFGGDFLTYQKKIQKHMSRLTHQIQNFENLMRVKTKSRCKATEKNKAMHGEVNRILGKAQQRMQELIEQAGFICECNNKVHAIYQILHKILLSHPEFWQRIADENYFIQRSIGSWPVKFLVHEKNEIVEKEFKIPHHVAAMIKDLPLQASHDFPLQQFAENDFSDGIFREGLRRLCENFEKANAGWDYFYGSREFYCLIEDLSQLKENWDDPLTLDRIRNALLTFENDKILPFQLALDAQRYKEQKQVEVAQQKESLLRRYSIFNVLQYIGGFNYRAAPMDSKAVAMESKLEKEEEVDFSSESEEDDEEADLVIETARKLEYIKSCYFNKPRGDIQNAEASQLQMTTPSIKLV